jgi:ATP-dependent RNA helicase RhlE
VINYELPNVPESYVHRIGRTARAGAEGVALSFCDAEERAYLRDIEKLTRVKLAVVEGHPYAAAAGRAHGTAAAPRPAQGANRSGDQRDERRWRPNRRPKARRVA